MKSSSLILIALAIGLFYTFTAGQYSDMKSLSALAAEHRNVLRNVTRIAESRNNLQSNYDAIPQEEKERLFKVLPDNMDTVTLARDLDAIAAEHGISIKSVQVETNPKSESATIALPEATVPYEKATVSFSFISDYPHFVEFLSDLEKNLRIMDMKSATFRVAESGLYEHQLTVETYWLK